MMYSAWEFMSNKKYPWKYPDYRPSSHLTTELSCLTLPPHGPIYTLPHICFGLNQCQELHTPEPIRCAAASWSRSQRQTLWRTVSLWWKVWQSVFLCMQPSHLLMVFVQGVYISFFATACVEEFIPCPYKWMPFSHTWNWDCTVLFCSTTYFAIRKNHESLATVHYSFSILILPVNVKILLIITK